MAYNEDSSASGHDEPWIQWFCGLKGHEMFCEVERAYIEDGFNLYGLRACVSNFSDCLDLILDRIGPDDSDDSHLTQSACTLYGLIHARYIVTAHGLDSMYNKVSFLRIGFKMFGTTSWNEPKYFSFTVALVGMFLIKIQYAAKEFGTCPLIQCNGQPVLPTGLKDEIGIDTVKIFCPKCQCVYQPPPIRTRSSGHHSSSGGGGGGAVDGAAFGTTFPHLFLMTFNNLVPDPLPADSAYIPRVFGFRVHQSVRQQHASTAAAALTASALSRSNNARRGGTVDSFTSQRVLNVTTANTAAENISLLTDTPVQEPVSRGEKESEMKAEKIASNVAEAGGDKSKASNGTPPKAGLKKAASANGDASVQGKEEKMGGNDPGDGNQSKRKGKEGDNSAVSNENGSSKSRASKRQKRQAGSEVT
ncbi:hypothetical protein HJC23_009543 [Cyclotella cryptica]|uniref:Casein kinase II subunit beta n=1 Tax=Cyclotella cryptica TaxID=29204 RepID=A0ABD3Q5H0_9STRA